MSPELRGTKADLDLAMADLVKVDEKGFSSLVGKYLKTAKDQLALGADLVSRGLVLSELAPAIAGYPDTGHFLILLQNSDELRPTGGFLGTVGVMDITLGEIGQIRVNDVYHLDMPASLDKDFNISPPVPMQKYLGVSQWFLRDSNWSPDWPTSAENIEKFYYAEAKSNSDPLIKNTPAFTGVIAITPRLVTDLLYLTGPITVNGKEYDKDNFVELLQYEVEMNYRDQGISEWDRKKVIGEIMKEMKNKLFSLPSSSYLSLLDTVNSEIEQKNLLIYFNSPDSQATAKDLGWGGEIKSVSGDYLMVVDANLAAFKTDRVMEKKVNYQLTQKKDGVYAKLLLNYKHTGGFDWKTTTYRTYTRVYVPEGSWLVKSSGWVDETTGTETFSGSNSTKTYFAGFIAVKPGESQEVVLEYKLPEIVKQKMDNGEYSLYLQKQPGNTPSIKISVTGEKAVKTSGSNFYDGIMTSGKGISASGTWDVDKNINIKY
jgi:hypothetical protein